jgi:hypothetical protein
MTETLHDALASHGIGSFKAPTDNTYRRRLFDIDTGQEIGDCDAKEGWELIALLRPSTPPRTP